MRAMAVSRPFLLALIGIALLGATVFAVQNAQTRGAGRSGAAAEQPGPALAAGRSRVAAVARGGAEAAFSDHPRQRPLPGSRPRSRPGCRTGTLELNGATDDSAKDPRVALDVKVERWAPKSTAAS